MTAIPKPPRKQKKQPKPLKRTPIKRGSRCKECRGAGKFQRWDSDGSHQITPCDNCNGTGRLPSKPIKTKAKPKRNRDLADFNKRLLASFIWQHDEPFHTRGELSDFHHILGRARGDYLFSSPYNAIPLSRSIHEQGWINYPEARALFLNIAKRQVDDAKRAGLYTPTDKEHDRDLQFLDYASQFIPFFA